MRTSLLSLRGRHRARAGPSLGTVAKASTTGVCGTSLPRMLNSQRHRMRVGDDERVGRGFSASRRARARAWRRRLRRHSADRAAPPRRAAAAGRSVQMASIGLSATATRLARRRRRRPWRAARRRRPYAARANSRASAAGRLASIHAGGGCSTRCSTVKIALSTSSRTCT